MYIFLEKKNYNQRSSAFAIGPGLTVQKHDFGVEVCYTNPGWHEWEVSFTGTANCWD